MIAAYNCPLAGQRALTDKKHSSPLMFDAGDFYSQVSRHRVLKNVSYNAV